jgi:hypothetical protein
MEQTTLHDLMRALADQGIKLAVPQDKDELRATPRERVTKELAEGIKANRGDIMRYALYRQAEVWIQERWPTIPADLNVGALRASWDAMNEAWDEDFLTYRLAVRDYVRTAQKEMRRYEASNPRE